MFSSYKLTLAPEFEYHRYISQLDNLSFRNFVVLHFVLSTCHTTTSSVNKPVVLQQSLLIVELFAFPFRLHPLMLLPVPDIQFFLLRILGLVDLDFFHWIQGLKGLILRNLSGIPLQSVCPLILKWIQEKVQSKLIQRPEQPWQTPHSRKDTHILIVNQA